MKVKILYKGDCIQCGNPGAELLCPLCEDRLQSGPFEINEWTEAWFLGNSTLMTLVRAHDQTGHPRTLKPLITRIQLMVPAAPTLFRVDPNDHLMKDIVAQLVQLNPEHATTTKSRPYLKTIEVSRYPARDQTNPTLCLMTH